MVSSSRIVDAGYHTILADLPGQAIADVVARNPDGLAGLEAVLQIRPQRVLRLIRHKRWRAPASVAAASTAIQRSPITAIFDAAPIL